MQKQKTYSLECEDRLSFSIWNHLTPSEIIRSNYQNETIYTCDHFLTHEMTTGATNKSVSYVRLKLDIDMWSFYDNISI